MKKYILSLIFFLYVVSSGMAQSSDFEGLCKKYKHEDGVVTLRFNGVGCFFASLFVGGEITEIGTLVRSCSSCRILVYEGDEGNKGKTIFQEVKSFIRFSGLEELVSVKEDNEEVKIYTEDKKDMIRQFFITVDDGSGLVCLHMKGKFAKSTIQKLMKTMSK